MARPLVAIVGRPNVGKSTLFNRLVGERIAIVEDLPGTTRDRIYATTDWRGREISLIDTGGLEDPSAGQKEAAVRRQVEAAIGRPNVGKSSFLNTLVGSERAVVSEIPGTTRDSIDTTIDFDGRPIVLVDTAGIRRRGRIDEGIEKYALLRTAQALERADVAILLTDATEGITAQDVHIAGYAIDAAVGIVLAANKWDVVDRGPEMTEAVEANIAREFHFAPWMGHRFVSAKTGRNVRETLAEAVAVVDERKKHVSTPDLRRLLTEAVAAHPPTQYRGRDVHITHVTQARGKAPTFGFFADPPEGVHFTYQRYLENKIRDRFAFAGTPIKIEFKGAHE